MSKTKNNELKFSIQNLINRTSYGRKETDRSNPSHGICHSSKNRFSKRLDTEIQTSMTRHPVPIISNKTFHPYWPFLSQLTSKNSGGNSSLQHYLIFLSKMNQFWERIQRTQISSSVIKEHGYDSNKDMDADTISMDHDIEPENDDDEKKDDGEGEYFSIADKKFSTSSNSNENDKLKNYPCTQCGKVRFVVFFVL